MKLKDITIRNIKPSANTVKLFDGGGLYLQVSPKGSKWWRLKYRFGGKEKCLSLGVYPDVGLKEARERQSEIRTLLSSGIDPSLHRQNTKAAQIEKHENSFAVIAHEWTEKYKTRWHKKYYEKTIQRLKRDAFPILGQLPITEITAPKLLSVLRSVEKRGAIYTAHRLLINFGQVFRYAIATGRAERDVAADLRGALPPPSHKHFAAITEPEQVGELLRSLDVYQGSLVVSAAIRLAPLVFVRPGELRHARWTDINFETAEWRYLVTKTNKEHVVPLARQALNIFKGLYPITSNGEYVFPNPRTNKRPMSENAVLVAMRSLGIPKEQMTGHGFRAMARTILDEVLGIRPDFIEHQLAHAVRDPNGRAYNRTAFLAERKQMMQQWADYLDELKNAPCKTHVTNSFKPTIIARSAA